MYTVVTDVLHSLLGTNSDIQLLVAIALIICIIIFFKRG